MNDHAADNSSYGDNDEYYSNNTDYSMYSNNTDYSYNTDYDDGSYTDYYKDYDAKYDFFYYRGFNFERPIYLYFWEILVVLTTLANILVIIVLMRKKMRNSTNMILTAIAISDSLTGMVTLPVYIYAYKQHEAGDLKLTEIWCETFMLTKFYFSRTFHTVSIWLTVILGIQRLVSVSFPFKAQSMFTMPKTAVMITVVCILSPFLHLYHVFNRKSVDGYCEWALHEPCVEGCVYLWLTFYLMHFIPCVLLVIVSVLMVMQLCKATAKMRESRMITNRSNLERRTTESRRISAVVIAVVVVFLIPEIPYGMFLLISVSLTHARKNLLDLHINRTFFCVYEILLVLSFHANFWIYIVMNRKFRRGLEILFDPLITLLYAIVGICGIKRSRRPSEDTSVAKTAHSDLNSRTNSVGLELKTYHVNQDKENNSTSGSHKLMVAT